RYLRPPCVLARCGESARQRPTRRFFYYQQILPLLRAADRMRSMHGPRTSADFALAWDCGRGGSTLPPGLRKVIPQRWPRSDLVPDSGHLARKRARLRLRDGATGAGPRDRFVTVTAETGGTGCVTGGRRPREAAGGQDRANRRGARQGVPAQAIGPGSARALKRARAVTAGYQAPVTSTGSEITLSGCPHCDDDRGDGRWRNCERQRPRETRDCSPG